MERGPIVGTGELTPATQRNESSFNWKTLGFALLIIVGIGGLLAMVGVGVGGLGMDQHWWQAKGLLSHLTQAESITLIAVGGGGLLLAGLAALIIRCMRNHPEGIPIIENDPLEGWEDPDLNPTGSPEGSDTGEISVNTNTRELDLDSGEESPVVDPTPQEPTPEETKAALLAEKQQVKADLVLQKQAIEQEIAQNLRLQHSSTDMRTTYSEALIMRQLNLADVDKTAETSVHNADEEMRIAAVKKFKEEEIVRLNGTITNINRQIVAEDKILSDLEAEHQKLVDRERNIVSSLESIQIEIGALMFSGPKLTQKQDS